MYRSRHFKPMRSNKVERVLERAPVLLFDLLDVEHSIREAKPLGDRREDGDEHGQLSVHRPARY